MHHLLQRIEEPLGAIGTGGIGVTGDGAGHDFDTPGGGRNIYVQRPRAFVDHVLRVEICVRVTVCG